jgi:hypothetical protein
MSVIRESLFARMFVCLLLSLFALSPAVFAQSGKGAIEGLVTDSVGGAVPGAQLQLAPLGIIGVSNSQGAFSLPAVPAGKYTLSVS